MASWDPNGSESQEIDLTKDTLPTANPDHSISLSSSAQRELYESSSLDLTQAPHGKICHLVNEAFAELGAEKRVLGVDELSWMRETLHSYGVNSYKDLAEMWNSRQRRRDFRAEI